jgi:hypothetical protein
MTIRDRAILWACPIVDGLLLFSIIWLITHDTSLASFSSAIIFVEVLVGVYLEDKMTFQGDR